METRCDTCDLDYVEPVYVQPERFSAEWWDDPAPHWACPYCDRCLELIEPSDPAYFPVAA